MSNGKPRLQEFEALRALAIILLLTLHSDVFSLQLFGVHLDPISHFVGAFLLGSFFFLAGYFHEASLQKPGQTPRSILTTKFLRIFPPYWMALVLFIFVMGYSLKKFDFWTYLLNLQFIFSPTFVKQMLTLWYISVVMGYYISFGVLIHYTKSGRALFVWSVLLFAGTYILHALTGLLDGRFFEYYFIFLAGVYFSRYSDVREKLVKISFSYKIAVALLGFFVFRFALVRGYEITHGIYLLAVNIYILGWVWMWLGIFKTSIGEWRVWTLVSTASFFAYLYHRPIWYALIPLLAGRLGMSSIIFQFIPGSIIVLILCYFLQSGYDTALRNMRKVSFLNPFVSGL